MDLTTDYTRNTCMHERRAQSALFSIYDIDDVPPYSLRSVMTAHST